MAILRKNDATFQIFQRPSRKSIYSQGLEKRYTLIAPYAHTRKYGHESNNNHVRETSIHFIVTFSPIYIRFQFFSVITLSRTFRSMEFKHFIIVLLHETYGHFSLLAGHTDQCMQYALCSMHYAVCIMLYETIWRSVLAKIKKICSSPYELLHTY